MELIFVFPCAFIIFGFICIIPTIILKIKCSDFVEAVIIDIFTESDIDGNISYYPVFRFYYSGTYHKKRGNFASHSSRYSIGKQVKLHIDPNDPERFYCQNEIIFKIIFNLFFIVLGIVLLLCFIKAYNN